MVLSLVLSYFDNVLGPKLFLRTQNDFNNNDLQNIPRLMDIHDNGYIIHGVGDLRIANLIFQIFNQGTRGGKETVMISIIALNEKIDFFTKKNLKIFELLLMNFSFKFKKIDEIYKGFYIEKLNDKSTREAYEKIKNLMNLFYQNDLIGTMNEMLFNRRPYYESICQIAE